MDPLFTPGRIGALELDNRIVRAGTAETMADDRGAVTGELVSLYRALAAGGAGCLITGHMFVHPSGRASRWQTGIDRDDLVPGLARVVDAVHAAGGRVLAQLSHAGSQSRAPSTDLVGPSAVPNPLTGGVPRELDEGEVEEILESFGSAAGRALAAGFDGVHIHGANGYLISEFMSPLTNQRSDRWGGSADRRDTFAIAVVESVRAAVPPTFPVTMKVGMVDRVPDGLHIGESLRRIGSLVTTGGLDGIEVSCGLMRRPSDSAARFVAVGPAQAVRDLLPGRLVSPSSEQAYFREWSAAVKGSVEVPVILTGGLRTAAAMRAVLASGDADFLGLARPLVRQPDLPHRLRVGTASMAACTSCNLCLRYSGTASLRCWRRPPHRLVTHVLKSLRR